MPKPLTPEQAIAGAVVDDELMKLGQHAIDVALRPPSTTPIETLNRCGVGVKGHGDRARVVLVLLANAQTLTAPQACELAAWLVVMADAVSMSQTWAARSNFEADEHFAKALSAIRNT